MTEMTEKDGGAKIRKGLSARRDSVSYQVIQEIVIPVGTLLRSVGDGEFAAPIGISPGIVGQFSVERKPGCTTSPALKAVIAS